MTSRRLSVIVPLMQRMVIALSLGLLAVACDDDRGSGGDDDAGPPASDAGSFSGPRAVLAWQMRCAEEPCPATTPPARTIDAYHGQAGHQVSCDLTIEGDQRRLALTALAAGSAYGLEVRGGQIGLEGGRLLGSLCQMRVYDEDDATILAPCGSNLPTADRPCQLQRVDIRDVDGVPTLLAELRCEGAAVEGSPTALRDVTAPASSAGYAMLQFTGCEGL